MIGTLCLVNECLDGLMLSYHIRIYQAESFIFPLFSESRTHLLG